MPRAVRIALFAALLATPFTIFTAAVTMDNGMSAHAETLSLSDTVKGYQAQFYADITEIPVID